jgi:outer membrane murein-binding lipoprotein Lpp
MTKRVMTALAVGAVVLAGCGSTTHSTPTVSTRVTASTATQSTLTPKPEVTKTTATPASTTTSPTPASYPTAVTAGFLRACGSALSDLECQCALKTVELTVPLSTFAAESARIERGDNNYPGWLLKAIPNCE